MEGKRLFERFGFNLPPQPKQKNTTRLIDNGVKWTFKKDSTDWSHSETGEYLTGYQPSFQLEFMLKNRVNIDLN